LYITMTYSCITSLVSSRRPGSPGQRRRTRDQFPLCHPPPASASDVLPAAHPPPLPMSFAQTAIAKNKQQPSPLIIIIIIMRAGDTSSGGAMVSYFSPVHHDFCLAAGGGSVIKYKKQRWHQK